ncbi:MAG: GNAT family N-acetyltransferase [Dermatophilaceae bacterium]|nr:GNAT family N-acetyltransferase [Dermatophilaceae bacterium]
MATAHLGETVADAVPDLWLWLWLWAKDNGEVVAAAQHTPPHGAYLSTGPAPAIHVLDRTLWLMHPGLPDVAGPRNAPLEFAAQFVAEAGVNSPSGEQIRPRMNAGLLFVWEVEGAPVSMAAVTVAEGGVSRIQYVYTPPKIRSQGYASSCVAALTARELAHPGRTCWLFTDLANPTSNGIYHAVGYRPGRRGQICCANLVNRNAKPVRRNDLGEVLDRQEVFGCRSASAVALSPSRENTRADPPRHPRHRGVLGPGHRRDGRPGRQAARGNPHPRPEHGPPRDQPGQEPAHREPEHLRRAAAGRRSGGRPARRLA